MKGFVIKDACAGLCVCFCVRACVCVYVTQNYRLGKSAACLLSTLPYAERALCVEKHKMIKKSKRKDHILSHRITGRFICL